VIPRAARRGDWPVAAHRRAAVLVRDPGSCLEAGPRRVQNGSGGSFTSDATEVVPLQAKLW